MTNESIEFAPIYAFFFRMGFPGGGSNFPSPDRLVQ